MATITRSELYGRIHKGLRKALFDLAYHAGRTDYADAAERASLKAQATETLHFLVHHGHVEDTFVLPLLEEKVPGITNHDVEDHVRIHDEVFGLQLMLEAIQDCATPEDCRRAGEEYYLKVNAFIADYLTHMHHEEVTMAPLFLEHCTPEALLELHGRIVANSSPNDAMLMLRYTVPSIDPIDRATFLGGIRKGAPAAAFDNAMQTIKPTLSNAEWTALQAALN